MPGLDEIAKQPYQPLTAWQPRLIRLDPGPFGQTVTCSLFTAEIIHGDGFAVPELLEIAEFEAISYSSGHSYATACNTRSVQIWLLLFSICVTATRHVIYGATPSASIRMTTKRRPRRSETCSTYLRRPGESLRGSGKRQSGLQWRSRSTRTEYG